jgi:hypothetical protein
MRRGLAAVVVAMATGSCAHPAPSPPRSAGSQATPRQRLVDEVTGALLRGDFDQAAAALDRARQAPQPSAELIAYFDATVHAYRGDYPGAAKVMADHLASASRATPVGFNFHNAMIALRTADGDLLGALVETEEMTRAGVLGTWKPSEGDRMTLVRLKEHWHRAYLLRMIAQTVPPAEREAFIGYAEVAREAYVALAAPLGDANDSVAVLDAYFAFCDGDPVRMREAARRVNLATDDDVEDLYLVQLALDEAGDHDAATAIRSRVLALTSVYLMVPVIQAWLRSDQAFHDQPRFSPRHPTGPAR